MCRKSTTISWGWKTALHTFFSSFVVCSAPPGSRGIESLLATNNGQTVIKAFQSVLIQERSKASKDISCPRLYYTHLFPLFNN